MGGFTNMPKGGNTAKGYIYRGSGGKGKKQSGNGLGGDGATYQPEMLDGTDEQGNPIQMKNPDYQGVNSPYQDTRSKFLGLIPMGHNNAADLNSRLTYGKAEQASLAPGITSLYGAQQDIATKEQAKREETQQAILTKALLERATQGDTYNDTRRGESLVSLLQNGNIPASALLGKGGSMATLGRDNALGTGSYGSQGLIAGGPAANLAASQSEYQSEILKARAPFAEDLGTHLGASDVSGAQLGNLQNQLGMKYAEQNAASHAKQLLNTATASGIVPGGFDLSTPGRYLQAPREMENSVPQYWQDPRGGPPMMLPGTKIEKRYIPAMQYDIKNAPGIKSAQETQDIVGGGAPAVSQLQPAPVKPPQPVIPSSPTSNGLSPDWTGIIKGMTSQSTGYTPDYAAILRKILGIEEEKKKVANTIKK